jgi:hypothetical protein
MCDHCLWLLVAAAPAAAVGHPLLCRPRHQHLLLVPVAHVVQVHSQVTGMQYDQRQWHRAALVPLLLLLLLLPLLPDVPCKAAAPHKAKVKQGAGNTCSMVPAGDAYRLQKQELPLPEGDAAECSIWVGPQRREQLRGGHARHPETTSLSN